MDSSFLTHYSSLVTLKWPQAVERRIKTDLKIAFAWSISFFKLMFAPYWPFFKTPSLLSCTPLFPPSNPLSSLYRQGKDEGYWWLVCRPRLLPHTLTWFSPKAPYLFLSIPSISHLNNVVLKPEWGQKSSGKTYCSFVGVCKMFISNQKPHISRCNDISLCIIYLLKIGCGINYLEILSDFNAINCEKCIMIWEKFVWLPSRVCFDDVYIST